MTDVQAVAEGGAPRRRLPRSVTALLVVVLAAAAGAGVLLLRSTSQESSFAPGRTSSTGTELTRALGAAIARRGSGHLETSDAERPADETAQRVDFVLRGDQLDFVADAGGRMRVVGKNGVVVAPNAPPLNLASISTPGAPPLELEGAAAGMAQSLKVFTFQQPGFKDLPVLSPTAAFTRTSTTDDGSSLWTGSWSDPELPQHYEAHLTVDAAGLPIELRSTLTQGPDSEPRRSGFVVRYSRWGQPVQVPEPTPFGTPPSVPEIRTSLTSTGPPRPLPSPPPSP